MFILLLQVCSCLKTHSSPPCVKRSCALFMDSTGGRVTTAASEVATRGNSPLMMVMVIMTRKIRRENQQKEGHSKNMNQHARDWNRLGKRKVPKEQLHVNTSIPATQRRAMSPRCMCCKCTQASPLQAELKFFQLGNRCFGNNRLFRCLSTEATRAVMNSTWTRVSLDIKGEHCCGRRYRKYSLPIVRLIHASKLPRLESSVGGQ